MDKLIWTHLLYCCCNHTDLFCAHLRTAIHSLLIIAMLYCLILLLLGEIALFESFSTSLCRFREIFLTRITSGLIIKDLNSPTDFSTAALCWYLFDSHRQSSRLHKKVNGICWCANKPAWPSSSSVWWSHQTSGTYSLNKTLCCGHMPSVLRILSMSLRMSKPLM